MQSSIKPHEWAIEADHLGGEFWKCFSCGASGGPCLLQKKWCFYADGSGIQLPLDCDLAKIRIQHHLNAFKKWIFPLPGKHHIYYAPHAAGFGTKRKYHHHEGVDLYISEGTKVRAVEAGKIVGVHLFTGPSAGSPWWLDTSCVMVEGPSGVVNYGEIDPAVAIGDNVEAGSIIGRVKRVIRKDKGKPMSMLHLELYRPGTTEPVEWPVDCEKTPEGLWDPTPYLRWAIS
jgi:murein DD-endopeptidase MepM/ murein hydrolase activator NlpD